MNNRNTPCSCGSGLKTKRCCGDEAKRAAKYQAAWAAPKPVPPLVDNTGDTPERRSGLSGLPRSRGPLLATTVMLAAIAMGGMGGSRR